MISDLTYLARFGDDVVPLTGNMTLGRHLDADVIVPGEDVLDFHVRIEVDDRGPVAHPLQDATFSVNGVERNAPMGLVVGDTLGVGSTSVQIGVEREHPSQADGWWLREERGDAAVEISGDLVIGRHGGCDMVVDDDHISRQHARLLCVAEAIWVVDLDSANGTRINEMPIAGGRRLLHGDLVRFDEVGFQVVGKGGELTGVRRMTPQDLRPLSTDEHSSTEDPVSAPLPTAVSWTDETTARPQGQAGSYLTGTSASLNGMFVRLNMGRVVIGRDPAADVRITEPGVAPRHVELTVRPEGVTLTSLSAADTTLINGQPIRLATLKEGDQITLGETSLNYHHQADQGRSLSASRIAMVAGAIALLVAWLVYTFS